MEKSNNNKRFVTPELFKKSLIDVCNKNKFDLVDYWCNAEDYTRFMLGNNSENNVSILQQVANELNLMYNREYWTLDAIMFRERDENHFGVGSNFAKYIEVAIEHENIAKYSHNEINKLTIINAYIKVLITYPTSSVNREFLLKEFAEIVKSGDIFKKCGVDFDQIVIFAPYKKSEKIEWEFYKYKNAEFIKF